MSRSTPNRFRFTKASLLALEPPASGRVYYYDERTPGLAICVTAAGSRVFYYYRKIDGLPKRIRLGAFPGLSVDDARDAAAVKAGEIAKGIDPSEVSRQRRQEPKLGELWQRYLDEYARPHKRSSSVLQNESAWNLHLSQWKNRRLSSIKRGDISALHSKLGSEKGPYAANRALELLRHMYVMAIEWELVKDNPAKGIKRFKERKRERFLNADEVPRFIAAVEQEEREVTRDFVMTALFTGARRSNVASMQWSELDLEGGVWRIPGEKFKNGEPQNVYLSAPALEILNRRTATANGSPFVFPSWGKGGHIRETQHVIRRVKKRAGLTDLRFHDLRRTLGSWQAATGASLLVIGKALGHSSPDSTAICARMNLDPVRIAVDTATAAMLAARGAKDELPQKPR